MKLRDTLLGFLVLSLVGAGVYWVRGRSHSGQTVPGHADPREVEGGQGSADEALPDVTAADASVDVGGVRVTLSVMPRPPVAFAKVRFRVRVESASAKASADGSSNAPLVLDGGRISFEMAMPMGDHRYALVPGDDGWQEAEVVLPFCKSGNPRWCAIVEGTVAGRPVTARFRVDLTKPASGP